MKLKLETEYLMNNGFKIVILYKREIYNDIKKETNSYFVGKSIISGCDKAEESFYEFEEDGHPTGDPQSTIIMKIN